MRSSIAIVLGAILALSILARAEDSEQLWLRVTAGHDTTFWAADGSHRLQGSVTIEPPAAGLPSPDGSLRAVVQNQALVVVDKDGKNPRQLSPPEYIADQPSWSPDGRQVAFVAAKGTAHWQVYIADADGQNLRQLTDGQEGARNPQFGSDGRLAYLASKAPVEKFQKSDLVVRDVRDPKAQPVSIAQNLYINIFAWSPDSKTIAYSTIGELFYHSLADHNEVGIAFAEIDPRLKDNAAFLIAWRPDSARIACTIGFLGDRQAGGSKLFGDDEVFILPRNGKPSWFSVEANVEGIRWEQAKDRN